MRRIRVIFTKQTNNYRSNSDRGKKEGRGEFCGQWRTYVFEKICRSDSRVRQPRRRTDVSGRDDDEKENKFQNKDLARNRSAVRPHTHKPVYIYTYCIRAYTVTNLRTRNRRRRHRHRRWRWRRRRLTGRCGTSCFNDGGGSRAFKYGPGEGIKYTYRRCRRRSCNYVYVHHVYIRV